MVEQTTTALFDAWMTVDPQAKEFLQKEYDASRTLFETISKIVSLVEFDLGTPPPEPYDVTGTTVQEQLDSIVAGLVATFGWTDSRTPEPPVSTKPAPAKDVKKGKGK